MGIRTPGLFIANEALYQLSYTPLILFLTGAVTIDKKIFWASENPSLPADSRSREQTIQGTKTGSQCRLA